MHPTTRPMRTGRWAGGHAIAEFVRELTLVLGAVVLYFGVRGLTEGHRSTALDHGHDLLRAERLLGLRWESAIQGLVSDSATRTTLVNWVYIWGHWPVITAVLIGLHHFRRARYVQLRNAMFISGAVGLVIFALYPVAPPRLLDVGLLDTVTLRSGSYRVLQPPAFTNQYAALPSLHVGWNLLVGVSLWRATHHRLVRTFAVLSPLAMAFAVVATANHYVIDGLVGSCLSLAAYGVAGTVTVATGRFAHRLAQRTARRRTRSADLLATLIDPDLDQKLPLVDDEPVNTPVE